MIRQYLMRGLKGGGGGGGGGGYISHLAWSCYQLYTGWTYVWLVDAEF